MRRLPYVILETLFYLGLETNIYLGLETNIYFRDFSFFSLEGRRWKLVAN